MITADELTLQEMYGLQESSGTFKELTELVREVNRIIKNLKIGNHNFKQNKRKIFVYKDVVPMEQLFALYAINKIASIANEKVVTNGNNIIKQLSRK